MDQDVLMDFVLPPCFEEGWLIGLFEPCHHPTGAMNVEGEFEYECGGGVQVEGQGFRLRVLVLWAFGCEV